jgi:hypothetical protein
VKDFVLVRGKSGRLYWYTQEVWQYMEKNNNQGYEFVVDHDDPKVLIQMQALVNKDIVIDMKG